MQPWESHVSLTPSVWHSWLSQVKARYEILTSWWACSKIYSSCGCPKQDLYVKFPPSLNLPPADLESSASFLVSLHPPCTGATLGINGLVVEYYKELSKFNGKIKKPNFKVKQKPFYQKEDVDGRWGGKRTKRLWYHSLSRNCKSRHNDMSLH